MFSLNEYQLLRRIVRAALYKASRTFGYAELSSLEEDVLHDLILNRAKIERMFSRKTLSSILATNEGKAYLFEFAYRIACNYARKTLRDTRLDDFTAQDEREEFDWTGTAESGWSNWERNEWHTPESLHENLERLEQVEALPLDALDAALQRQEQANRQRKKPPAARLKRKRSTPTAVQFLDARMSLGYTRKQMARVMGIPTHIYESIEDGITQPETALQESLLVLLDNERVKLETSVRLKRMSMREIAILWCDLLNIEHTPKALSRALGVSERTAGRWFEGCRPKFFSVIMKWHTRAQEKSREQTLSASGGWLESPPTEVGGFRAGDAVNELRT